MNVTGGYQQHNKLMLGLYFMICDILVCKRLCSKIYII